MNPLLKKKRLDRWWRFNTLKKAFVAAQQAPVNSKKEVGVLDRALRRIGYRRAPHDLVLFWRELLSQGALRKPQLDLADANRMETLGRGMAPEMLPAQCWLDLYRLCIGVGFFQTGRILRDHGLCRMITDALATESAGSDVVIRGLYAALENGHFEDAEALLGKLERLGGFGHDLAQARWFFRLLQSGNGGNIEDGSGPLAERDCEFGAFVRGQRVALVGPVPNDKAQGAEIDDHDIVAKFGYRGGEKGRDPETQGERLDISYYNNTQAHQLAESDYGPVFAAIRWAVFHNRKGRSLFPAEHPGLRQLASIQWLLPDTHFNAGPNAILDLLRFHPAGIRVFNTDLMLSSGRFAGYTPAGAKPVDYTRSFIKTHDPVLQYQIMRRLWSQGCISGDDRFNQVMGMGLQCYLDELQQAHGARDKALF
ncbi:hypothetical protein DYI22_12155 [Marinobacter lipolyticus]|nr:hypothetical protein [Marinobacter lipolyticus]